ncbi:Hypothetical_protein [Hexamita inflata]|uniref:Hypothetical_protein n=1 Tax=Hexamita inflata TaxID=28002 RepID=A0AA86Q0R3_9EUKA|nr:Hypothetical protein HINF_LOCUS30879 [Hexamita inflata]
MNITVDQQFIDNRTMQFLIFYVVTCVLELQYELMRKISNKSNRLGLIAIKSVRALFALRFIFKQRLFKKKGDIKKQLVFTELFFQYLFIFPNQYLHPYNAILCGQMVYLLGVFGIQVFHRLIDGIQLFVCEILFLSYITSYNFHSLKYFFPGMFAANFFVLYYFQNSSKNQSNVESINLKQQQTGLQIVFDKHYSEQIQEINEEIQPKVVVATIRTNLNPQIQETVKFTRLVEQICKQYPVKTIQVSSQVFQFFIQENTIQKMLDKVVQICAGAQVIAESLGITVSAGIAFGDIEQVTQIFGNLQYKCFYGDIIEISDIVSQQSFDQIMVELSSLYAPGFLRKALIVNFYGDVPNFEFGIDVIDSTYKQYQMRVTTITAKEQMQKQIFNVFEKTGIKLQQIVHDNQDSDSKTLIKMNSNSLDQYQLINFAEASETSTPITQIKQMISLPIHEFVIKQTVPEITTVKFQSSKNILLYMKKVLTVSQKLSKHLLRQYKKQTSSTLNAMVTILFNMAQGIGLFINLDATFVQIQHNYGVISITGQVPASSWLQIFQQLLIIDSSIRGICLVILIYFYIHKDRRWGPQIKPVVELIIEIIEKILFCLSFLYNFLIQYSLEIMFELLDKYSQLIIKHNAVAHGWLIIFYSNFNFMQALNISAQRPYFISKSAKGFILMEIVHYARMAKKFPQYVLFMAVSQVSQIPWLLQQASVGVNNIGTKIKMRDYIKKQAVILSRHRPHLQASGELLIITKDQPTLNQDVIGQLNVKYQSVKYPESGSDLVNRVQAQLKDQLPHFPVVLFNNAVVFRLDFPTRPAEETNCLFADVTNAFSSREHLSLLSSSRNAARWISYHEKNDANSAYWHLQLALYNVLEVLHRHPEAGAALSFGDLKGVTLCYEDVRHDAVGEAAEELEQIVSAPGRLTVSKRFWAQFVQRALENCGGQKQNLQFQKQFVDGGKMVQLWK